MYSPREHKQTNKQQQQHQPQEDMTSNNSNSPLLVPETILKRKHDLDELKAKHSSKKTGQKKNRKVFSSKKSIRIVKPEKYIMAHRGRVNHAKRFHRVKLHGMQKRASDKSIVKDRVVDEVQETNLVTGVSEIVPITSSYRANSVGAKVVFVIRIRDGSGGYATNAVPKSVHKTLSVLRLRNVYDGVFVRYNESTRKMLHLVEPFVVYGIVTPKTVQELITRRGHCKVEVAENGVKSKNRVAISDNIVIEEALGDEHGIICVEDLVHEICNPDEAFKAANSFLWPFQLTAPKSKFEKNTLKYREGGRGEYGDMGEAIDQVIRSMM